MLQGAAGSRPDGSCADAQECLGTRADKPRGHIHGVGVGLHLHGMQGGPGNLSCTHMHGHGMRAMARDLCTPARACARVAGNLSDALRQQQPQQHAGCELLRLCLTRPTHVMHSFQAAEGLRCLHLVPVRHSHRQTPKLQAGQSVSPAPHSERSHLHKHAFAGSASRQDLGPLV